MFVIAESDLPIIERTLSVIIETLSSGMKRVDCDIDIGDEICPLKASGYWTNDLMRIDIRINNII